MMFLKAILVVAAALLLVNPVGASSRANQKALRGIDRPSAHVRAWPPASPGSTKHRTTNGDMKVLAEGNHSEVTKPFLAVARDPGTYVRLRKLAPGLPELLDEFFKQHLVVAAFMGECNTAGYSVDLSRTPDGVVRVAAREPKKGAMVAQVITTPFKVIAIPNRPWMGLAAETLWQQAMTPYRLTSGRFTISGGFAGRSEEFGLEGEIRLLREGKLVTFVFDLRNSDGKKRRFLKETSSGIVSGGQITIYMMSAGELIEMPHGDLSATGKFSDNHKALELNFISLPTMIADGYGGQGSIEAETGAPTPAIKSAVAKR